MIHIFIVNPYAGRKDFADNLREKLNNMKNFEYYIFNSRYSGHEAELIREIREIFDEDRIRIYCCGGSGTLRNVISGIDDFENIEVACFPCGRTNDFLQVFGKDERYFSSIDELIKGEVIDIDYIKTTDGACVNTFTQGLDTYTVKMMNGMSLFQLINDELPYLISVIYGVLIGKTRRCKVETEFGTFEDEFIEMFFGNGKILGGNLHFFDKVSITDGKLDVRMIRNGSGKLRLSYVMALLKNDQEWLDKYSIHGQSSYVKIKSVDGKMIPFNHDGELIEGYNEWEARIVNNGLHFVIPKGVRAEND